jgi:hypothetical protein
MFNSFRFNFALTLCLTYLRTALTAPPSPTHEISQLSIHSDENLTATKQPPEVWAKILDKVVERAAVDGEEAMRKTISTLRRINKGMSALFEINTGDCESGEKAKQLCRGPQGELALHQNLNTRIISLDIAVVANEYREQCLDAYLQWTTSKRHQPEIKISRLKDILRAPKYGLKTDSTHSTIDEIRQASSITAISNIKYEYFEYFRAQPDPMEARCQMLPHLLMRYSRINNLECCNLNILDSWAKAQQQLFSKDTGSVQITNVHLRVGNVNQASPYWDHSRNDWRESPTLPLVQDKIHIEEIGDGFKKFTTQVSNYAARRTCSYGPSMGWALSCWNESRDYTRPITRNSFFCFLEKDRLFQFRTIDTNFRVHPNVLKKSKEGLESKRLNSHLPLLPFREMIIDFDLSDFPKTWDGQNLDGNFFLVKYARNGKLDLSLVPLSI